MELKTIIPRRKSTRKYTGVPVDAETLEQLDAFLRTAKPLDPEIAVHWEVWDKKDVSCILPWLPPQILTIYSEEKDGWLENVGFLFQQADLWLQARGLGVCWLGMGQPDRAARNRAPEGMTFAMMLAFGHPQGDALRPEAEIIRRKTLRQIADQPDDRLEPARLAPSSINSQPWYFTHNGSGFHVYCLRQGLLKNKGLGAMNRIDIGICLAHLFVANPKRFRFFRTDAPPVKGCGYIGSVKL